MLCLLRPGQAGAGDLLVLPGLPDAGGAVVAVAVAECHGGVDEGMGVGDVAVSAAQHQDIPVALVVAGALVADAGAGAWCCCCCPAWPHA